MAQRTKENAMKQLTSDFLLDFLMLGGDWIWKKSYNLLLEDGTGKKTCEIQGGVYFRSCEKPVLFWCFQLISKWFNQSHSPLIWISLSKVMNWEACFLSSQIDWCRMLKWFGLRCLKLILNKNINENLQPKRLMKLHERNSGKGVV